MTPTTDNRTMVASPIAALLKSRKAIAAIVGVLLNIVIALLPPELAPIVQDMRGELMLSITALVLALIGGISWEDGAEKRALQIPPITAGSGDVTVNQPQPKASADETSPPSTLPTYSNQRRG